MLDEAAKAATEAGETERGVQLTTQALTVGPADDVRRRIKRLLLRSRLESNLLRAGHTAADVAEATRLMPQVEDQRFRVRTIGQLAALTTMSPAAMPFRWPGTQLPPRPNSDSQVSSPTPATPSAARW